MSPTAHIFLQLMILRSNRFFCGLKRYRVTLMMGLLGLLVSMAAIVGDLVESLLKRDAQIKDAGRLLPGMGGVLDRIDSALLGIPVMYYMLLFYVFWMTRTS